MRSDLLFILATSFILLAAAAAASSKKATTSTLHFYMHDIVGTSNDTTITVAMPSSSFKTAFGTVRVMDDKLTEGPSVNSKQVGRAQGVYLADSLSEVSLLFSFAAVFDNGTLSFHGQDAVFDKTRELSVIGGTGAFRFATGYAAITTYELKGLSGILDVTVFLKQ